jgi:hypothetical protein
MKLIPLLATPALVLALALGATAARAGSSVISNLVAQTGGGASDLSALMFPADSASAEGLAISISPGSSFSLSNIRITVLDTPPLAAGQPDAPAPTLLLDHSLSAGQAYFFQVTGKAMGLADPGSLNVAPATPVPEPGSYALMLAGLALLAQTVRRRRVA